MIALIYFSPRLVIKDWAKIVIKVAELGSRRLEEIQVRKQYLSYGSFQDLENQRERVSSKSSRVESRQNAPKQR